MEKSENNVETVHDYLKQFKWMMFFGGFTRFKKNDKVYPYYFSFRIAMTLYMIYLDIMAVTAAVLSYGNTIDMFEGFHIGLLSMVTTVGLVISYASDDNLEELYKTTYEGIYNYEERKNTYSINEEYLEINKKRMKEITVLTHNFYLVILSLGVSNYAFVPVIQYFMVTEDTSGSLRNPYLPQPFYMPFNTRTVLGFSIGYSINVLFMIIIAANVFCMDTIYVSCVLQMKTQFEILNHSLKNIDKRADLILLSNKNNNNKERLDKFDCLVGCLRENARHHQALLRLII